VLKDVSVCVTAWGSGFRLGSTMEFSGYDDSLNAVRLAALERGARAICANRWARRCASAGAAGGQ
jgi:hypothetical protein